MKQIKYAEGNIAIKKQLGKDASFEEGLVRSWQEYLPGGSKHYRWLSHSYAERHRQPLA